MVKAGAGHAELPANPRILSLSKYIPYNSIPHAGGQYLNQHLDAMRRFAKVSIWAPNSPLNRTAMRRADDPSCHLLEAPWPRLRGPLFRLLQLESVLAGSSIYEPVRRLFRGTQAPWADLEQSDLIELQWSEMIALAPSIRKRLPSKRLIGVAHDVITQRWQRAASNARSPLRRLGAALAGKLSARRERNSFEALDTLIVFSEKDANFARELCAGVNVRVVRPGLGPKQFVRHPDQSNPTALFVGAMSRPENDESIRWFLREIWPTVSRGVPKARFVVAGAHPSAALIEEAQRRSNVIITGYVEDFTPYYETASVAVVPLRLGAGVKFKTIEAMLFEVPVITTQVGAEGIDAHDLFAGVTEDAAGFAAATIEALNDPPSALAERARHWAEDAYGRESFSKTIREIYQNV